MNYLPEMEWSTKWDWENFGAFGSKASDNGEIESGSFNLLGSGRSIGASGSDGGKGSSGKSSISASTDSLTQNGINTPDLRFMTFEGSSGKVGKKMEMEEADVSEIYQPLEPSFGSMEPLIGLKLGKRTYFENSGTAGYVKSSSRSVMPIQSTTTQKKTKFSSKNAPTPFCQVEGCNIDLSTAKEYHRKHKVCDIHSKCPKVIVGGLERRFCQQCSRFHSLFDFDDKKRSCRNRLSDHNARRRKPQQKLIHYDSTSLSSPIFGGMQQMNSLLNNSPLTSMWASKCYPKFTLTKGIRGKSDGDGCCDEPLHMQTNRMSHVSNMHGNAATEFLAPKNSTSEVVSPGSKGSLISSQLDAAPEYHHRALSLLSSSNWGSCGPESVPVHHPIHENYAVTQYPIHANANGIPEGVPFSSMEFWPTGWQPTHLQAQLLPTNSNFQLFKTPYESDFYSNLLN